MNQSTHKTFKLSPQKRSLFDALLSKEGIKLASLPPITKRRAASKGVLSFAQERLWFLDQLEPNKSLYNIPSAKRLAGRLDVAALERSLSEIVRRHESLRTNFVSADGEPLLKISAPASFHLPLSDLCELSEVERLNEAQRWARRQAEQPFDLAKDHLLRARLLRLSDEDHVLLLTMHHIISDGWSMNLFFHELALIYNACLRGEPSPLSEPTVQYSDFAAWQREQLNEAVLARELSYWREQLAGAPDTLVLPTDKSRAVDDMRPGGVVQFHLPERVAKQLRELSQRAGATLFMTLLATFQILLWRLSGQTDILIGTPIAGRTRPETEELIGLFVNTLVLRARLQREHSFLQTLDHIKRVCLEAYAHQELPFEKLVDTLQPRRILNHQPLFQVMFQLQQSTSQRTPLEGIRMSAFSSSAAESEKFDLSLAIAESPNRLTATLRYNTELFEAATIERLAEQYQQLLQSVVRDSQQRIGALDLLSAQARRQVLCEWNQTERQWTGTPLVHEAFAQQAARTPERVAVEDHEGALSYRELHEQAERLARYLVARGVGAETPVGLCLERSRRLLVGVLGVLQAGGAYVPLPWEHPRARLAQVIAASGLKLVLSESKWREKLSGAGVEVICLDEELDEEEAQWARAGERTCAGAQRQSVDEQNLIYVMYTSGSTGAPKGVMIQHASLMNQTRSALSAYEIGVGDRVLQFAALSFDTSGEELYTALVSGATLVLRGEGPVGTPREFLRGCAAAGVTVLDLPTAYWHEVAAELARGEVELPPSVRLVIVGGEKLERWAVAGRAGVVRPRLINSYGPTEATIEATRYEVRVEEVGREVPIGRAIENVQVYVLDEQQQAVPVGVWGELYIGGVGVGRGYWGRAELTAERFVPDPYSTAGGARLYRTGDVCRYRGDGELEYGWRVDEQVKVHGQRLELGEVEAALSAQPEVRASVVRVVADAHGEQRIIAYVVLRSGVEVAAQELRRRVGERLPAYMIPAIVFLKEFPLTASFKIDFRALPLPERCDYQAENYYVAPRSAIEEMLAGIWREMLRVDRVGIYDNFFELGGHSLLAIRLITQVRKAFGIELPVRVVFEAPTVEMFAKKIEETSVTAQPPTKTIRVIPRGDRNLEQLLKELEGLSTEEVRSALASQRQKPSGARARDDSDFANPAR